jgi:mono/diheme cytochrome c family protein
VWTTLVFVLVFVGLALGVLFVALSGGTSGARARLASQSRGTRRLALVNFVLGLLILGIGIPAAVIASVDSRNSIPTANVSNLSAAEEHGRDLFGQRCRNCHTLKAANAVAQVGPNLDNLRPPKNLVLDAIHNGRARGNGQMAADLVEGQDADDVAAFVAKSVGQSTSSSK